MAAWMEMEEVALVYDWVAVKFATISIQDMFTQFVNEDHWDSEEKN